ncbi:hypothetical protein F5146DRAFT_1001331 [Armillaria mellea]|nr:hypothetical protein F5146DRAFT_1001331 [Armillaria mellea]
MARTDKPFNPVPNIVYSVGKPSGQSKGHKYSIMLGQGIQTCPFMSDDIKITSHTEGSRAALQLQLDQRNAGRASFTAEEEILNKTNTWFRYIMDNGCGYNIQEAMEYSEWERAIKDHIQLIPTKAKQGQKMKKTCQGRIGIREQSYICCEHYRSCSCKHFVLYPACGGGYNFEYFKIELWAHQQGYGLLMSCITVHNINSVKVNCDSISPLSTENGHWTSSKGDMLMTKMVKELCPAVEEPMVAHLHPSLANLDHIASYLHTEVKVVLPHGTGWDGVVHIKRIQDKEGGTPYIQHSLKHEWDEANESDEEEGPLSRSDDDCFQLIHVPGWNEFELVSIDCKMNQEHQGILHWAADQHRRQAKGLGLHLQDIAREMGEEQRDLHEPGHSLYSLGVYEHLYQILHICEAHITQGIASCAVPDYTPILNEREEQQDKDSFCCLAWLNNKRDSKFALQGMCWEKSFIPLSIWQVGDTTTNAAEISHIDIYRERMPCSLVGGISHAHHYDKMPLHIHRITQKMGVKASYRPTTVVVSVTRKYKHTDKCIGDQNKCLFKPTDLNTIKSAEKHKKAYEKHKQKSLDLKKQLRGQSSG